MTARLFGTDGIRGPFGAFPLDRPTVAALGAALGRQLGESADRPLVVVGGDTRASTPELCSWLATGLRGSGIEVRYAGTAPTPAVAFLTRELGAACGIAVSASHNPMPDNGLKLIDGAGFKWTPEAESALEERLRETAPPSGPDSALEPESRLIDGYLSHLAASLPGEQPLAGLEVVLDCAHGAASAYAPDLFTALGARVSVHCARPDGLNINDGCGSTHPRSMAAAVADGPAVLGVAFDGDADRALFADEEGRVRDGDAVLYLWGRALAAAGALASNAIVATSMSNLGLEVALRRAGIELVRCDVGDQVVVDTMRRRGIVLGGEQSGHIVHLGLSTTGDGMLTAIQLAAIVRSAGKPLSELLRELPRFPQTLQKVRVRSKPDLMSLPAVAAAAAAVERRLGDAGRLVLRYSGTEPVARVMIEGPEQEAIERLAAELLTAIDGEIGVQ